MPDRMPSDEWIEAANCLATVAHQLSSALHEANNLLQVIGGSAEMIQLNGDLPDAVLKRATTIAEHAHRVSALLAPVRDLSKFASRHPGETTDLMAVVKGALDMRRHALNRGQVALSVDAWDGSSVARASWRPAMQIVLNLLLNAEQAVRGRPGGAIVIRVARDGNDVVLSVSDNGSGFEAHDHPPFTLQLLPDGPPLLGLGLRTACRLAENEGGRLGVSSQTAGTTVTLRLGAA